MMAAASIAIGLLVLELGLRLRQGAVLEFSSLRPQSNRNVGPGASYHPQLGWVPKAGATDPSGLVTVTDEGLRSNGDAGDPGGRPILTLGDSFTFGNEVADSATWPAQLGRQLGAKVVNGGVYGYGVDQACQRGTLLLARYRPNWVILAFIRDDVHRTQFSYYFGWKSYYELRNGELLLRNSPVPRRPAPAPRLAWLRTALGYSHVGSTLARRFAEGWWYYGGIQREHAEGVAVSTELVSRLRQVAQANGARLLVVALATGGVIGSDEGMHAIAEGMRRRGVEVLDLVSDMQAMVTERPGELILPGGHYSPWLNRWVAGRVAEHVRSSGADPDD
jgi:hypothetical protein